MADYTTTYVFRLDIEGGRAVEKAREIRQQLDRALAGASREITLEALGKSVDALTTSVQRLMAPLGGFAKTTQQSSAAARALAGDIGELARQFANLSASASGAQQAMRGGAVGSTAWWAPVSESQANAELRALYQRVEGQKQIGRQLYDAQLQQRVYAEAQERLAAESRQREIWQLEEQRRQAQNYTRYMGMETARQEYLLEREQLTMAKLERPMPLHPIREAAMAGMVERSREIWPIRSLGYGAQNIGRTMLIHGAAQAAAIAIMTKKYLELDYAATRAGQAMEMQTQLQPMLRQEIMDTSVAVGRFDTSQVAEGLRLWAAGIGAVVEDAGDLDKLMGDTLQIQKLAALNNVDFAGTVDTVGGIMHEYGMTTADVTHITETLNYVAAKSFANVNDLGEAFRMVGPIAHSMGITFDETAAALALLSDANIKGTMAGRAFRQMLIQMQKPSAQYNQVMNKSLGLTRSTGDAWRKIVMPEGKFMGLPEYIDLLAARTENLTQAERAQRLAALSTANELPTLTTLVLNQIEARKQGVNVLSAYTKVMEGVVDAETITFQRMMEDWTGVPFSLESAHARMTGMWEEYEKSDSYRADRLKRRWENAFIEMGEVLTNALLPNLESLMGLVEGLAEFLDQHPFLAKMMIGLVGFELVVGRLLASLGSLSILYTTASIAGAGREAAMRAAGAGAAGAAGATGISGVITSLGGVTAIAAALAPIAAIIAASLIYDKNVVEPQREALERRMSLFPEAQQQEFNRLFAMARLGDAPAYFARNREGRELIAKALGVDFDAITPSFQLAGENLVRVMEYIAHELYMASLAFTPAQRAAFQEELEYERATQKGFLPLKRPPRVPPYEPGLGLGLDESQTEIAQTYYDYTQKAEEIEADFITRRQQMVDSYNDWRLQAEQDLVRQLTQANEDYAREGARRLEDYNRQVAKVNEEANRQEAEQERRHLDNLRKAQRDHRDRLIDLLEEGDVRGIVKEMRRYRRQREDLGEDLAQQRARRADDRARRLQEMDEQFRLENARREEDFNLQQQRAEEAFALEQQRRKQAIEDQIVELSAEKQRALDDMDDTLVQALSKLMRFATQVEMQVLPMMYQTAVKAMAPFMAIADFLQKMAEIQAQVQALPGPARGMAESFLTGWNLSQFMQGIAMPRASGGYVDTGLYAVGERGREFVVSAPTTRLLESKYGQLSQDTFTRLAGDSFSYAPYIDLRGATGVDLPTIRRAWKQDMDEAFERQAARRRTPMYH